MANSFINSLETLNLTSVTNVESLSFYLNNNDTSLLARMPALGTSLVPTCIFRAVVDVPKGMSADTDTVITLGSLEHDSRSAWVANSAYYQFDFSGWVIFNAGVRFIGAAATAPQGMLIEINSVAATAPIHIRREEDNWSLQCMAQSAPTEITSGDIAQYYARSDTSVGTLNTAGSWLEIWTVQTNSI